VNALTERLIRVNSQVNPKREILDGAAIVSAVVNYPSQVIHFCNPANPGQIRILSVGQMFGTLPRLEARTGYIHEMLMSIHNNRRSKKHRRMNKGVFAKGKQRRRGCTEKTYIQRKCGDLL
jgi:hypothetical protein